MLGDRRRGKVLVGADGLGGVEVEAADEHAQPGEQQTIRLVEQIDAPGDRITECLMMGDRCRSCGGEQGEPVVESFRDLAHAECRDPRGGEFQR